jgi:sulfite exporter TauE/SafE
MDDLRRPIGILFSVLGLILLLYGIFASDVRADLDHDANVNLQCGIILVVFGGIMLWLSFRTKRS